MQEPVQVASCLTNNPEAFRQTLKLSVGFLRNLHGNGHFSGEVEGSLPKRAWKNDSIKEPATRCNWILSYPVLREHAFKEFAAISQSELYEQSRNQLGTWGCGTLLNLNTRALLARCVE